MFSDHVMEKIDLAGMLLFNITFFLPLMTLAFYISILLVIWISTIKYTKKKIIFHHSLNNHISTILINCVSIFANILIVCLLFFTNVLFFGSKNIDTKAFIKISFIIAMLIINSITFVVIFFKIKYLLYYVKDEKVYYFLFNKKAKLPKTKLVKLLAGKDFLLYFKNNDKQFSKTNETWTENLKFKSYSCGLSLIYIISFLLLAVSSFFLTYRLGELKNNPTNAAEKMKVIPPKFKLKKSVNYNNYIHSFFGTKYDNYAVYLEHKAQEDVSKNERKLASGSFWGNYKDLFNVTNDNSKTTLWEHDFNSMQFVVIPKDSISSMSLSIVPKNNIEDNNISVSYGWSKYVYASNNWDWDGNQIASVPNKPLWIPENVTQNHTLKNIDNQKDVNGNYIVYVAWINFYSNYDNLDKPVSKEYTLKLDVNRSSYNFQESLWQQENNINVKIINHNYNEAKQTANNNLTLLTNDSFLAYNSRYINRNKLNVPWKNEEDKNDYNKYLDWIWNEGKLTQFYSYAHKYLNLNNYTMFFSKHMDNYDNGDYQTTNFDQSWNYSKNNYSFVTWHIGTDEITKKRELYIPESNKELINKNLDYVSKTGINKIYVRGLMDASRRYGGKFNSKNLYYDDNTKHMVQINSSDENTGDEFGFTGHKYKMEFVENILNIFKEWNKNNKNKLTPVFYFDERDKEDIHGLIDDINIDKQAWKSMDEDFPELDPFKQPYKIAWSESIYNMDFNDNVIFAKDQPIDELYFYVDSLNEVGPNLEKISNERSEKNKSTGVYTVATNKFNLLSRSEPGNSAFFLNAEYNKQLNSFLKYAISSWTYYNQKDKNQLVESDSVWTSNYEKKYKHEWSNADVSGDTVLTFPLEDSDESALKENINSQNPYFNISNRYYMLSYGLNNVKKLEWLKEKNNPDYNNYLDYAINFNEYAQQQSSSSFNKFHFNTKNWFKDPSNWFRANFYIYNIKNIAEDPISISRKLENILNK